MPECRLEKRSICTASESDTEAFGAVVGRRITGATCISLTGPLGSGKSVLARGICSGLGVKEPVISPTFILYQEYRARLTVVHCDLYRLEHEQELEDLGLFERIGDVVVLVEWGDRSPRIHQRADVVMGLEITGASTRRISVSYGAPASALFGE